MDRSSPCAWLRAPSRRAASRRRCGLQAQRVQRLSRQEGHRPAGLTFPGWELGDCGPYRIPPMENHMIASEVNPLHRGSRVRRTAMAQPPAHGQESR